MDESERLQRYRMGDADWRDQDDDKLANRIAALLNDKRIDQYCMVDAYYYDFSVIPRDIQEKLQLWRDVYLIYGITTQGEIISKWIDRWDLDSDDEIVDGKVIRNVRPKWINVKDQKPVDDRKILCIHKSDCINPVVAYFCREKNDFIGLGISYGKILNITHWIEVPYLPED